jgi:hypothetical protein
VHTDKSDGFLFERGPRSLLTRKGEQTVTLVNRLGLASQVVSADQNAYKRYIWLDGKPELVPQSLAAAWSSPLTAGMVPFCDFSAHSLAHTLTRSHVHKFSQGVFGAAAKEMFTSKSTASDESIYSVKLLIAPFCVDFTFFVPSCAVSAYALLLRCSYRHHYFTLSSSSRACCALSCSTDFF